MELKQIGVIRSPYLEFRDAPRQGRLSENEVQLEIFPQFSQALK